MKTNLGKVIRALRLGFGPGPGCFVRIQIEHDHVFRCDVYPDTELIPPSAGNGRSHFIWWDAEKPTDLRQIDLFRHLKTVKRYFVFYFDDNGKTL